MKPQNILILAFFAIVSAVPLCAQDALTFHMGGGISTPLNPTGQYAGTSGNFVAGAGLQLNKRSAVVAEFMWSGLPSNLFVLHPVNAPFGSINLYTLTANYRYSFERIHGSRYGKHQRPFR